MPIPKETMDKIQWMQDHPIQLDIVTKGCFCTQHIIGEEIVEGLNGYPQKAVPSDCIVTVPGLKRRLVFSREEVMEVFSAAAGEPVSPVVSSLNPNSAVLGAPSFTLRVLGSGFAPSSIIVFNGSDEPTTFVSPTEITTGVNMETAGVAVAVPVKVRNANGLESAPTNFTFTEAASRTAAQKVEDKKTEVKVETVKEAAKK